ncbi:MAG TPA: hypothetical protein VMT62_11390 [Syntrophorhabdaceae bacterium]|nr:hypothetical protein [Syntrophorhabdaceae bacterium]
MGQRSDDMKPLFTNDEAINGHFRRGTDMKGKLQFTISGVLTILWGIAHLFPASSIVRGFGDITLNNKRIILMEWINEGLTLIFIGSLIITITFIKSAGAGAKKAVYILCLVMLVTMAVVSLLTGFKIDFIAFRLCPLIFVLSAVLLLVGMLREKGRLWGLYP